VEKGKEEFEQISKTIKQETKRFDKNRVAEFKKSLTTYLEKLLEEQQAVSLHQSKSYRTQTLPLTY
jgi:hypothetical protein